MTAGESSGRLQPAATGIDSTLLKPGFNNVVLDAQHCFRAALQAMSRPAIPVRVDVEIDAPAPMDPALAALALTLFDSETPVWVDPRLDSASVRTNLRFHCGCPFVESKEEASFAMALGSALEFGGLDIGHEEYPERSGTLIIQLPSLAGGELLEVSGPGVDGNVVFGACGLPGNFVEQWSANHLSYPQGIDIYLVCGQEILGLPRSVALHRGRKDPGGNEVPPSPTGS